MATLSGRVLLALILSLLSTASIFVLDFINYSCNKEPKTPFCVQYGHLFADSIDTKKLLCCFCVIYNLSETLLVNFFKSWKKTLESRGFELSLTSVTYEDSTAIFNDKKLEKHLYTEIEKALSRKEASG